MLSKAIGNLGSFKWIFVLLLIAGIPLFAQTTASISGNVPDTTGAVVPDAHISLTNERSGDKRQTTSNNAGYFTFAGVEPGTYTIHIEAKGFRSWETKGFVANPGDTRAVNDIHLSVGGSNESVEVSSTASEIQPEDSGERAALLTSKDIDRLAIESRNISELLKILPGVTSTANGTSNGLGFDFSNAGASGSAIGNGLSTNGAPYRGGTAYLLDGANIIDPGCACFSIATVNPDMTQEVKVQTSNFGADSPQGPVVVNSISKSGSAKFHGQAYLYARNGILNSNTWQDNHNGIPRPEDSYYYPGGNIGGPVRIPGTSFNHADKLLFWGGFESFRQNLGSSAPLQSFVPTDAMRAGDFSATGAGNAALCASAGGINSGQSNFCNDLTGTVTPNGTKLTTSVIPTQYLDPGALSLLKLFPEPNVDPNTNGGGYNYFLPTNSIHNGYIYRARVDYNLSDNTKFFVSYQGGHDSQVSYAKIYTTPANAIAYPGGLLNSVTDSRVLSGTLLHVFSASLTNELRLAWGWLQNPTTIPDADALSISTLAYPYSSIFPSASNFVPSITSPGARTFPDISQPDIFQGGSYTAVKSAPSLSDDATWVKRSHAVKIGFFASSGGNKQGTYGYANGNLNFVSGQLFDAAAGEPIGSKNPLANFLLGITGGTNGTSGFSQTNQNPIIDMSYKTYSGYVLDNWKVTNRLTLNLGVRLEHVGRWEDKSGNGLAAWFPDRVAADAASGKAYPGVYWHAIDSSVPNGGSPIQTVWASPRVGLAYDMYGTGRTILRGGWGAYRWNDQFNDYAGPLDTALGVKTFNSNAGQAITLQEVNNLGKSGANLGSLPTSVNATDSTDKKIAVTYAYNFTVSQRVGRNSLLEIAYVGNNSQNVLLGGESSGGNVGGLGFANQNKIPLGGLFKPDPITGAAAPADPENVGNIVDYYPFGSTYGTNSIEVFQHRGYANYNALQVSFVKQAGRFSYNFNYSWSKALGIVSGTVDAFTVAGNYGVLNIDRPHVFNSSYSYEFGSVYHGDHLLLKGVSNGWNLSGITTLQAGGNLQALYAQNLGLQIFNSSQPITSNTYYGTPAQQILPLLTCNPHANLGPNQKLNLNCFTAPQIGQVGDRQFPYLSGPAYFNSDLAIFKTFSIHDRQNVQFRLSAFNFVNHPLGAFNTNDDITIKLQTQNNQSFTPSRDNSSLGTLDTKIGQRVLQLALKYSF